MCFIGSNVGHWRFSNDGGRSLACERSEDGENILFKFVGSSEGIKAFHDKYPDVTIITGGIDEKLDDDKYIVPGLGILVTDTTVYKFVYKHFLCTISGLSRYSSKVTHIFLNVDRPANMEPPIHVEYFRSGGA